MLELKNICYKVHNNNEEKEVLKDISLQLSEGCTVITGPNGGGKSTLAKMIMGIISPDSGSVFLDGKDITSLSITDRAKLGVSFAFQQPVRFKGITVKDLIPRLREDPLPYLRPVNTYLRLDFVQGSILTVRSMPVFQAASLRG
jgi:Fe-S cluster assembly ATP-binding protein